MNLKSEDYRCVIYSSCMYKFSQSHELRIIFQQFECYPTKNLKTVELTIETRPEEHLPYEHVIFKGLFFHPYWFSGTVKFLKLSYLKKNHLGPTSPLKSLAASLKSPSLVSKSLSLFLMKSRMWFFTSPPKIFWAL